MVAVVQLAPRRLTQIPLVSLYGTRGIVVDMTKVELLRRVREAFETDLSPQGQAYVSSRALGVDLEGGQVFVWSCLTCDQLHAMQSAIVGAWTRRL